VPSSAQEPVVPGQLHVARLTAAERTEVRDLIAAGVAPARTQTHARILLKCDIGTGGPRWTDERIAEAVEVSPRTVARVRARFATQGLAAALARTPPAHIPAQARRCPGSTPDRHRLHRATPGSDPLEPAPAEQAAGRAGGRRRHQPRDGARHVKKNELKPWLNQSWRIPPQADAAFVARMEDVLRVYDRLPDPRRPPVCFDETRKALRAYVVPPLPPAPGRPARYDSEYEREGSANLFAWVVPHLGRRGVTVHATCTAVDWPPAMRELVDGPFAEAETVVLVSDNLNTHDPASLYKVFPIPDDATRRWTVY
jgi:hypothetical protein